VIWVENGKGGYEVIHPMVFVEFFVPGLRGLQVHQMDRNRLRLVISAAGDSEQVAAAASDRMKEILAGKGLQGVVDFDIDMVESILPDKRTGKTRMVISHIGPPKGI